MTFEDLKRRLKEALDEYPANPEQCLSKIEPLHSDVKKHDTEEAAELGRRLHKAREALTNYLHTHHEVQSLAAREAIERLAELLSSFGI